MKTESKVILAKLRRVVSVILAKLIIFFLFFLGLFYKITKCIIIFAFILFFLSFAFELFCNSLVGREKVSKDSTCFVLFLCLPDNQPMPFKNENSYLLCCACG